MATKAVIHTLVLLLLAVVLDGSVVDTLPESLVQKMSLSPKPRTKSPRRNDRDCLNLLPKCMRKGESPPCDSPSGSRDGDLATTLSGSSSPSLKKLSGAPDRCSSSHDIRSKARSEFWEILDEDLKVTKQLGAGSVGNVFEGEWRGMRVAVKSLINNFAENSTQYKDFIKEINMLSGLRHPLLVTFLGVKVESDPPCIVQEMMEGGSIEDLYAQKAIEVRGHWAASRQQIHGWVTDVLKALRFLHEGRRKVIHRDIKPANIMLTKGLMWAKLGDFGLSKEWIDRSPYRIMSGKAGTVRFMAPEVFREESDYDEKIDIYSLSMCVYFMITGLKPFEDFHDQQSLGKLVSERNLRPSLVDFPWPEMEEVLREAWAADAQLRPSAARMLEMMMDDEVIESLDKVPEKKKHNPFAQGISF